MRLATVAVVLPSLSTNCNTLLPCRSLMEQEERLDDLTIDEALAMYPKLAQEIKDEIEAGAQAQ